VGGEPPPPPPTIAAAAAAAAAVSTTFVAAGGGGGGSGGAPRSYARVHRRRRTAHPLGLADDDPNPPPLSGYRNTSQLTP
jgi:hypothetical protein